MRGPHTKCALCHAIYEWGAGHDCPRLTYQAQQAAQYHAQVNAQVNASLLGGQQLQAERLMQSAEYQSCIQRQGDLGTSLAMQLEWEDREYERTRAAYEDFVVRTAGQALTTAVKVTLDKERERANHLADECGRLKDENGELLRENAVLRRKVERLERKR